MDEYFWKFWCFGEMDMVDLEAYEYVRSKNVEDHFFYVVFGNEISLVICLSC